jgi:hypothetical protein
VSWKSELKPQLETSSTASSSARSSSASPAIHQECCAAACSSPCTCTPATATCTPTFRSTPTTTRCCRPPTRGRAHHGAGAGARRRVSGEHGIGITKLEFLTDDEIQPFRDYKARVDPEGRFNKGKLLPGADLGNAYTPSFSLLGTESLIMEQSRSATSRR